MTNVENVQRLVLAGWRGMTEELQKENSSVQDVVNAAVSIASAAIRYACSPAAGTPEAVAHNRRLISDRLQQLLLETTDPGKVM